MRHMPPPMPAAHSSRRLAATATAVDTGSPAAATPSPSLLPLSRGALQPSPPPPRRGATVATTVAATVATTLSPPSPPPSPLPWAPPMPPTSVVRYTLCCISTLRRRGGYRTGWCRGSCTTYLLAT